MMDGVEERGGEGRVGGLVVVCSGFWVVRGVRVGGSQHRVKEQHQGWRPAKS